MSELLIAIALLCGQPNKSTMSYYALTDDRKKELCQRRLAECLKSKTFAAVSGKSRKPLDGEILQCVAEMSL